MKAAPYCPDTLNRIRRGATAHDLGWDAAMYASVCRRHEIPMVFVAPPAVLPAAAPAPKPEPQNPEPAPPRYRATVNKRDGSEKPKAVTVSVTYGMYAGAHATAHEDNTSASTVMRQAMAWGCDSKIVLTDWRKGSATDRCITVMLSQADRERFERAAAARGLKLTEFARRALAGFLKHQSFGA